MSNGKLLSLKGNKMTWRPMNCSQCIPSLVVKDAKKAIEFYTKAFGFKLHEDTSTDEKGDIQHAMLQLGECTIMLSPEGAYDMPHKTPSTSGIPSPLALYIYVPNVDTLYKQAIAAGARSLEAPMDSFWGDRFCKISDLEGYEWMFATHNPAQH
jgi:uncharacterized glyoxalase superfamily protein PhnB